MFYCYSERLHRFLEIFNVPYEFDTNCKDKRPPPFDFKVFYPKIKKYFLIEFQGSQHYKVTNFPEENKDDINIKEERLKRTQKHDKIKKEYCENNNIELLIIPYWDFAQIKKILNEKLELNLLEEELIVSRSIDGF